MAISKYTTYVPLEKPSDLGFDFFAKALQYKGQKMEQNYGAIQNVLNSYSNLDVMKESDRQYLQAKLNDATERMNNYKDLDLSNVRHVTELQTIAQGVLRDKTVQSAIQSTKYARDVQRQWNEVASNPKLSKFYSSVNYNSDMKKIQAWVEDSTPGTALPITHATLYSGLNEEIDKAAKSVQIDKYDDLDPSMPQYITTVQERNSAKIRAAVQEKLFEPSHYKQMSMEYEAAYGNASPSRVIDAGRIEMKRLEEMNTRLKDLSKSPMSNNAKQEYLTEIQNNLQRIGTLRNLIDKGDSKSLGLNMYQESIINGEVQKYQQKNTSVKTNQSYFLGQKLGLDVAKFNYEQTKDREDFLLKREQIDVDRLKAFTSIASELGGAVNSSDIADVFSGKKTVQEAMQNMTSGSSLSQTIFNPDGVAVTENDYFTEYNTALGSLKNENASLYQSLAKSLLNNSSGNSGYQNLISKLPQSTLQALSRGGALIGDEALKQVAGVIDDLHKASGGRVDGIWLKSKKLIDRIYENNYNAKILQTKYKDVSAASSGDKDEFNKQAQIKYGDLPLKQNRAIPLSVYNTDPKKDFTAPYFASINTISDGTRVYSTDGKSLGKESVSGKDTYVGKIDWNKSKKLYLDGNKLYFEPRNKDGDLIGDNAKMFLTLTPQQSQEIAAQRGVRDLRLLSQENKSLDSDYASLSQMEIKQLSGYPHSFRSSRVPENLHLTYNIKNFENDSYLGTNAIVEFNLNGERVSKNFPSLDVIKPALESLYAQSKDRVERAAQASGSKKTAEQLEAETSKEFFKLLRNLKD